MASDARPTTITVPTYVRKILDRYKLPGQTYADVLLHLIEEVPTAKFLKHLERISEEEDFVDLRELEKEPGFY
jgi:hypothetical protein